MKSEYIDTTNTYLVGIIASSRSQDPRGRSRFPLPYSPTRFFLPLPPNLPRRPFTHSTGKTFIFPRLFYFFLMGPPPRVPPCAPPTLPLPRLLLPQTLNVPLAGSTTAGIQIVVTDSAPRYHSTPLVRRTAILNAGFNSSFACII